MSYAAHRGNRPVQTASKSSHGHIINDSTVKEFLGNCKFPKPLSAADMADHLTINFQPLKKSKVLNVVAFDGGYSEIIVKNEFPSSKIAFFQFGVLFFEIFDLESLENSPFISPEDMSKLKNIDRLKLTIPIKNIIFKNADTLVNSIRQSIHEFLCLDVGTGSLAEAFKWLIFEEYQSIEKSWSLASCPHCKKNDIGLKSESFSNDFTAVCHECKGTLYLSDILRLHEVIDEELGAGEVLGYISNTVEQLLLVSFIKELLKMNSEALSETIFIKDGPLAFFGQTANLHKPMRSLCAWLQENHDILIAGLEKSGAFVNHAHEISENLGKGQVLFLDNEYIYNYITPGKANPKKPYGMTSYYSSKIIYKTEQGSMHVISMPTREPLLNPKESDFHRFDEILTNIQKLRCDMYDSALIPVALANKLVSLANHPSTKILQKFAINNIKAK